GPKQLSALVQSRRSCPLSVTANTELFGRGDFIRRRILSDALKLFDLTIMVLAFALATVPALGVGRTISMAQFFSMRVKLQNFIIFLGLLILWHVLFSIFGLYASHRMSSRASQSAEVVKATSLGSLGFWGAAALFHIRMASLP